MDFLDSLNNDLKQKKLARMRSWYLYEQYRSLENNQKDAFLQLKDRNFNQELSERKARRCLYDRECINMHPSTLQDKNKYNCENLSNELFEDLCEIHSDGFCGDESQSTSFSDDTYNREEDATRAYMEEYESIEEAIKDCPPIDGTSEAASCVEEVPSVIEHCKSNELIENISQNLADDIKEELELVKMNISDNISMQMETMQENLECVKQYESLRFEEPMLPIRRDESVSHSNCEVPPIMKDDLDLSMYMMWSKLVSFAYQIVQLNHGNCYYDYSAQFLTAVLACDVLRKGLYKMWDILQPYVSPVNLYSNVNVLDEQKANKQDMYPCTSPNSRNTNETKILRQGEIKPASRKCRRMKRYCFRNPNATCYCGKRCSTNNCTQHFIENRIARRQWRLCNKPWHSLATMCSLYDSTISLWPMEFARRQSAEDYGICKRRTLNPMLKLGCYIDSVLNDLEE